MSIAFGSQVSYSDGFDRRKQNQSLIVDGSEGVGCNNTCVFRAYVVYLVSCRTHPIEKDWRTLLGGGDVTLLLHWMMDRAVPRR